MQRAGDIDPEDVPTFVRRYPRALQGTPATSSAVAPTEAGAATMAMAAPPPTSLQRDTGGGGRREAGEDGTGSVPGDVNGVPDQDRTRLGSDMDPAGASVTAGVRTGDPIVDRTLRGSCSSPGPLPPPAAPPSNALHLGGPRVDRSVTADPDHVQLRYHPPLTSRPPHAARSFQYHPQHQQQPQHHHHHHSVFQPSSLQLRPLARRTPILPSTPLQQVSPPPAALPRPQFSRHYSNRQVVLPLALSTTAQPPPPPPPPSSFLAEGRPRLLHAISCPAHPPGPSPSYGVRRQASVPLSQPALTSPVTSSEPRRPDLHRSLSRTQTIKNYIRKSTVTFFGVDDENEEDHRRRWMERRRRMASKCYGQVKPDYESQASREEEAAAAAAVVDEGDRRPSCSTDATETLRRASRSWSRQVSRMTDPADGLETLSSPGTWVQRQHSTRQKESVARLTWNGLSYIATTVARRRSRAATGVLPAPRTSTSVPSMGFPPLGPYDDSVFEDTIDPFSHVTSQMDSLPSPGDDAVMDDVFYDRITTPSPVSTPHLAADYQEQLQAAASSLVSMPPPSPQEKSKTVPARWRRSVPEPREVPDQEELSVGMKRMWKRITDQLFDNSDRRQYGMGVVGRYLKRSFRKERITSDVREQLDDIDDHRPFFTYWITTVQILITIISLAAYGFGPVGFEQTQRSALVLVTSLSLQQVDYYEPDNFWIGPRAADLVHLGAKFTPCMRRDWNVFRNIESDRALERNTACCIRNDNSGCVQTSRDECSATISTWKKWSDVNAGPGGRISGSVCGQDPSYCTDPPSAPPYSWPDDITKWPICRRKDRRDPSRYEHMACEVIGHPCCIGILGECHITTPEYCDFVKGYFHEEAALCSQVSCLDDICGMIPFYNPDVPDQFYRLWTSLFLHAGLVHLSITVLVQYFLMRDLEKLTGALRIGIIYIVSGVAGNLASAIFVPYRAEVGPAGSQFGLLACLIVEVIHCWRMLKSPGIALLKLLSMVFILFVLGLLPWIDNYAHLFGFMFGFLLSYALLPFVSFGTYDRGRKITLILICLLSVVGLFAALVLLFYVYPVYDCEFCKYLTCLPLTENFCTTQGINITSRRQL